MSSPAWTLFLDSCFGPSTEGGCCFPFAYASNVVLGNNPPYTIQDFFANYPKWGGVPYIPTATATTTEGSPNLTLSAADAKILPGQPIAGPGISDGTFVLSVNGVNVVLTAPATETSSGEPLTIWNATLVPVAVIQMWIALASACLIQARWDAMWTMAMGLFVAHYATLYARSDGDPTSNIGQAAAQGLAFGIQVAKSVGDVSVNYQAVDLADWGAWNLTTYGQQLAQMARGIGAGPMLVW